jgi:hypothetical protein
VLNILRRKPQAKIDPAMLALRAKLFAMDDLETLVSGLDSESRQVPPWSSFTSANKKLKAGQKEAAIADLQQVIAVTGLETRVHLLAWHNLRALGVQPPAAQSKLVRGMVIETPVQDGLDVLAAYSDHTARYFNFSGSMIIWDTPEPEMDKLIDNFLASGRPILKKAQPWNKPEPGPPAPGYTRISLLTDSGLHFGQAPGKIFSRDALAGPPLHHGAALMKALTQRVSK